MIEKELSGSEMNLTTLTKDLANYNLWANMKMTGWLKTKPSEKMVQEVPSSFPTIKLTLKHIADVQNFWLQVIKQESPPDLGQFGEKSTQSMEEVFSMVEKSSKELSQYVHSLTENSITGPCQVETPWFKETRPKFEFILQVMNHSTYHRGQITTIGRNAGLTDAPMTDFNVYSFSGKPSCY
jgi:uncharacterized damage-inducible protein DinB